MIDKENFFQRNRGSEKGSVRERRRSLQSEVRIGGKEEMKCSTFSPANGKNNNYHLRLQIAVLKGY